MEKFTCIVWTEENMLSFADKNENPSTHSRKLSVGQFENYEHRKTKQTHTYNTW